MHKLIHVLTPGQPTISDIDTALEPYGLDYGIEPYVEESVDMAEMKKFYSDGVEPTPDQGVTILQELYADVVYNPDTKH